MDSRLVTTVHQWLSLLNIRIEKSYLRQRLMSHPDFPSALSITSLLDDLGIENSVAQIEEKQLNELPTPFLAFVDNKEFLLITDIEHVYDSIKDFGNRWNGIVIFAEKSGEIMLSSEVINANALASNSRKKWILSASVYVLLSGIAYVKLSIPGSILFIVNSVGLIISGSIVLRELGIETLVSNRLCGAGEDTGCDAALYSKASTLPLGIKLSDVGVSFFLGIFLLLLVSSFAAIDFKHPAQLLIAGVCFASIPFTLFSIYYQWRITKKWCNSCLLIVTTLWIMAAIQLGQPFSINSINIWSTLGALGVFMFPGALWFLVRKLLNHAHELLHSNILLQRIYRSSELFESHLFNQQKVDISPWPEDFQIGNAHAACQLVVVSSHFCGPCSETHELLQNLLVKFRDQFGITIRFLGNSKEAKDDRKAHIMRKMLQYALSTENFFHNPEKIAQMLNTWYAVMDAEKFNQLYPAQEHIDVEDKLKKQRDWYRSVNIQFTPTIFINGYELRSPYSQADLLEFSSTLLEIFSEVESTHEYTSNQALTV